MTLVTTKRTVLRQEVGTKTKSQGIKIVRTWLLQCRHLCWNLIEVRNERKRRKGGTYNCNFRATATSGHFSFYLEFFPPDFIMQV
jgi:hypothetical protein